MKFWSDSWANGDRIPARHAACRPDGAGGAAPGLNLHPHLAWSDVPAGARSLVLVCHDFDMPRPPAPVNRPGQEIAPGHPRQDFFHWLLVDLPARPMALTEGAFRRGFTPRGASVPASMQAAMQAPHGARQGLNDCSVWFDDDPVLAGTYCGYDGPLPPWNDALVHHYVFTLYAVALARLPVEGAFTGAQVRQALAGRVLAEATYSGTYTVNPRLLDAVP